MAKALISKLLPNTPGFCKPCRRYGDARKRRYLCVRNKVGHNSPNLIYTVMEENKTMKIYNLIVLDESGSMSSIYNQALSGINEVINGIRQNQEKYPEQKHFVSIVTFEGEGMSGVKTRRDCVPVGEVTDLTKKDYRPGGCTPLYDAMGKAISELDRKVEVGDGVLVTIITDGMENSSQEYSGRAVKNLVAMQRKKGWTFAYIGANQDAVEVARDLNIQNAMNYDATPEGMVCMSMVFNESQAKFAKRMHLGKSILADVADFFSGSSDEDAGEEGK